MKIEAYQGFGGAVAIFGIFILGLWCLNQDLLHVTSSNSIYMVFNTALCFTLQGAALFFHRRRDPASLAFQGLVILGTAVLSVIVLAQDILNINLGVDQMIVKVNASDLNPHPGRMAPQTAISFILSSIALILINRNPGRRTDFFLGVLTIAILGFGIMGLAGATVTLDIIYEWYKYSRMAVPTALCFILLGAGYGFLWLGGAHRTDKSAHQEQRRISVTNLVVLLLMILASGLAGFGILSGQMEKTLRRSLQESFANHTLMMGNEIDQAYQNSLHVTTRIVLNEYLKKFNANLDDAQARQFIAEDAATFIAGDISAIRISGISGDTVTTVGHFIQQPDITMPLKFDAIPVPMIIIWNNSAYVRVQMDIKDNGSKIGEAVVERKLSALTSLLFHEDALGATAETRICQGLDAGTMQCLPSRLHREVSTQESRTINGHIKGMSLAIDGKSGDQIFYDYRARRVMSAYGPFGQSGIGIVVKIDTEEFYGPVRDRFQWMLMTLAFLGILGAAIQRLQLTPLIDRLVKSEKRAQTVMDSVANGIVTVNDAGIIESYNHSFCDMFGWTPEELEGASVNDIMPEVFTLYLGKRVSARGMEVTTRHRNGCVFELLMSISSVQIAREWLLVGSMQDITERKRLEKMKNEFVSTVSHELRTPLTSIRGSLGLIAGGKVGIIPGQALNLLNIAYNNCERLVRLINDILDIEKMESGRMVFNYQSVDLAKLVAQTVETNKAFAEKYDVKIEMREFSGEANVYADADRVTQVLTNLISNAAKFSPSGSTVTVAMEAQGENIRVDIADQGEGIPETFRGRIFEKFAQADSSDTRAKGGTGLGLSIVKTIIEQMSGSVGFESKAGKGTRFYFTLPLIRQQGNSPTSSRPRILICEDERDIAYILSAILQKSGFDTDIAPDARSALEKLAAYKYAAMTLDLNLPDRNGIAMIRDLRSHAEYRGLPIIVISATAEEGRHALNGEAIGVVDWLVKPIDQERLAHALELVKSGRRRILHVEDDPDIVNVLKASLGDAADVVAAVTMADARRQLEQNEYDLVVLDIALPDGSGTELIPLLGGRYGHPTPVILFTATEVPDEVARQVNAVLIKSRLSEDVLVGTILKLIKGPKAEL